MSLLAAWWVIPPFGEEDLGPQNSFIPFSTSAVTNMECWLQADTQVMVAERRKTYPWRSLLLHESFHPFAKKNLEPGTQPSYFQARLSQNWDVSFRRTSRWQYQRDENLPVALFTSWVIPSLREEDLGPRNSSILCWLPMDKQVVVADEGSQCLSLVFTHTTIGREKHARSLGRNEAREVCFPRNKQHL